MKKKIKSGRRRRAAPVRKVSRENAVSGSPFRSLLFVAAVVFVLGIALYARTREAAVVFVGGDVVALDPDSQYHIYRSQRTLADFPRVPAREPLLNWPDGAFVPWAPGFDQLLALPAFLAGAPAGSLGARKIAARVPVGIGLACVALVMMIVLRAAPQAWRRPAAVAAGMLAAVLPVCVLSSRVGRTDHHAFEALSLLAMTFLLIQREQRQHRFVNLSPVKHATAGQQYGNPGHDSLRHR